MKRKWQIPLIVFLIFAATLACSFVQDTIGSGESEEEVVTLAADVAVEPPDDAAPADTETTEDAESGTMGQVGEGDPVPESDDTQAEVETTPDGGAEYDTSFPLPDEVQNFMEMGNGSINFATDLSVDEAIAFYRQAFEGEGLTERTILTAITDATFSMVFDGHLDGTIVIQGVDLDNGTTNINIRFEDV